MLEIEADNLHFIIDAFPNRCPLCHHAIEPRYRDGIIVERQSFGAQRIDLYFQCPQRDCKRAFLGSYVGQSRPQSGETLLTLRSTAPYSPEPPSLPDEVVALSPSFNQIFAQSAVAEAFNLAQIAGAGYRKALEFLIKDFCISEHPAKAEDIKATFLGAVIDTYVTDVNIKECAKRATWLGNDESHYTRKWEDKDITDLKALIALTVSWINTVLLTHKYLRDMTS